MSGAKSGARIPAFRYRSMRATVPVVTPVTEGDVRRPIRLVTADRHVTKPVGAAITRRDKVFMKAAPFEYARPADIDEACAMLAADDAARGIAGGQTLVPLMAMRLARPSRLIDIGRLAELAFVRKQNGEVMIGAVTRQCVVERDPLVAAHVPLLAKVMPWVGHAATRSEEH